MPHALHKPGRKADNDIHVDARARQKVREELAIRSQSSSLSADVRMNSAEFLILRTNEDLYASKRETYFFVGRARLKSSCSSVLSLFHVATTCESDASW